SLSSSIFLVAGTTIGAGILAIPAVTQESGFLASAVACIGCWVYMVATGLLIAEVNVNTMCELDSGGVSLVSMAKRTVGSVGVQVACQRIIGAVNGLLVLGIITAFTALVVVASADLHLDALLKANFEAVPSSIPVIALAYVYHNVVPVLCTNLEGDLSKVRTAVVVGTAIPLLLFLVWNGVILGTFTNLDSDVGKILDPLQELRSSNGVVGPIVDTFSIFAIGTSYIGFVLGLADFLADLLKLPAGQSKPLPYLITLLPPLVLALLDPEIFFKALDFAGTYGVLMLFGILPAAMSWSDRYLTSPELPKVPQQVPGGKVTLFLVMGGAAWVISSELLNTFNHSRSL
uniref:Tryptophan/tyrosine permease n=1 Tax=Chenopodium quinoa TaxID=63459 RepID=A0A803KMI5_CHEQI